MNYGKYECFQASYQGRVLTLTMNRPADMNAVNKEMHDELGTIFYDAQLDDDADVIVLTGAGRVFSAGGDLAMMKRIADGSGEPFLRLVDAKRIVFSLLDLEKPIIAAVNGHAMGLGATIALLCDTIFHVFGGQDRRPPREDRRGRWRRRLRDLAATDRLCQG